MTDDHKIARRARDVLKFLGAKKTADEIVIRSVMGKKKYDKSIDEQHDPKYIWTDEMREEVSDGIVYCKKALEGKMPLMERIRLMIALGMLYAVYWLLEWSYRGRRA